MDTSQETGTRTDASQTQPEADIPTVNILGPKTTRRVGCWNVRTLYQTGKLAQVVREMDSYNIWTGTGKRQLATGHSIAFSGRTDDQHDRGVALIMNKEVHTCLIGWRPINERIMSARFNSSFAKLTVIACYAPTEMAEDVDKEAFYDTLQETVEGVPTHDVLLILGDFNAKVGQNNTGRESTMGVKSCGNRNENGERLVDFCQDNGLVIGGTLFQHKDIHKWTWNSPDGHTNNQIDHVIINKKWRSSLQDVRANRGADVGSDHALVTANIKLKLRKAKQGDQRKARLDVDRLKDPAFKRSFQIEVRNRFSVLGDQQELDISTFNQTILEAGENFFLGKRRRTKEQWISDETWKKIDDRKLIKRKLVQTKSARLKQQYTIAYSSLDKEVKRSARRDKQSFIDNLATDAEEAAKKQDLGTLYRITKVLTGAFTNTDRPVRNQHGDIARSDEEILHCWKEHFEKILNRDDPHTTANIPPAENEMDINVEPPTLDETRAAIKKLKNGKTPGIDGVQAELLKADDLTIPVLLHSILIKIWNSETAPDDWTTGLLVKLPKKG